MSEHSQRRIKYSDSWRSSSQHDARVLDIIFDVKVYLSSRILSPLNKSDKEYRLFGEAGRSYAFDQRGTGYGRGEGCGLIILKPLDQAIKDNDPIRAVIAGSGINQDGKTPGITMPNGSAQGEFLFKLYSRL